MIDDDSSNLGKRLHRVDGIRRNHGGTARPSDLRFPRYCDLELAIDDVPDLVVRMGMLMNP